MAAIDPRMTEIVIKMLRIELTLIVPRPHKILTMATKAISKTVKKAETNMTPSLMLTVMEKIWTQRASSLERWPTTVKSLTSSDSIQCRRTITLLD